MGKITGRTVARTGGVVILLMMALLIFGYGTSQAFSNYLTTFETTYAYAKNSAIDVCILCHTTSTGGARNAYGTAFANNGHSFTAIQTLDSDGDTFKNIIEIKDLRFPGNAASKPAKPVVTGFTIPATSSSLVVKVTTFTATDNAIVAGYKLTTSATAPLASSTGWSKTAPTNYTFPTQGIKTLYAWAKDRAGLVSASKSASVTIKLTDTTKPVVTAFKAAASATAGVASITSFTATDNVKVTGYKVTKTITAPLAGATGWTLLPPTSFKVGTSGPVTLYGWAKDAAGNVSLGVSSAVTVKMPVAATASAPLSSSTAQGNTAGSGAATGSLMPMPSGAETFTYDKTATPVRNTDPATAKPVGVGQVASGGKTLDLTVSVGRFESPMNVYLTVYVPGETSSFAPVDVYALQPDNTFKPLGNTGTVAPWKTNVTDINTEIMSNMPLTDLPAGQYLVVLTATQANNENAYYEWITHFIVR